MKYLKTFKSMNESDGLTKEWMIFAGLGGGFGGAQEIGMFIGTEDEANREAWRQAVEEYEGMVGMHGLRDVEEIMEEDGIEDYEEAQEISNEERESWLDYWVEEYDSTKHDNDERLN